MDILTLFFIFIALELFESNWQKSDSLHGLIFNNYTVYNKNILLYFLFNPTFIYAIFLGTYLQNNSFLMLSILALKFFDIAFKIGMMQKISKGTSLDEIMPNVPMNIYFRYMNAFIYPITFLFAVEFIKF